MSGKDEPRAQTTEKRKGIPSNGELMECVAELADEEADDVLRHPVVQKLINGHRNGVETQ